MNEWQPIETAPRDGTDILIMSNDAPGLPGGKADKCWAGNTAVASWWGEENRGAGAWICYMSLPQEPEACFEPTHWMQLPEPPDEPRYTITPAGRAMLEGK